MADRGIAIVHAVPGRIRLKISRLKGDSTYAGAVRDRLLALPGILHVETNTLTASVVVSYNESTTTFPALVTNLSGAFHVFAFPELDRREIESMLTAPSNGAHPSPTPLANRICRVLGTVDESVDWVTGGSLDLRVLLPLTLFILAMGRLLSSSSVQFPTWFDLLWFSFGTFVALNLPLAEQLERPP
jgi:hypothetical protein